MSVLLDPPGIHPNPTTFPPSDLHSRLGSIPIDRIRQIPTPGTATLDDLIRVNESRTGAICELIDGTLVEKAVGLYESWIGSIILGLIDRYLEANDVGMITGGDGVMRILPGIGRAPDVSVLTWASLQGGKPPPRADKVPAVAPDLAVEVLSESNTKAEMVRKRGEYFRAGVKLVWEIDPKTRLAVVYRSDDAGTTFGPDGVLDASPVLPGFTLSMKAVYDRADRMRE